MPHGCASKFGIAFDIEHEARRVRLPDWIALLVICGNKCWDPLPYYVFPFRWSIPTSCCAGQFARDKDTRFSYKWYGCQSYWNVRCAWDVWEIVWIIVWTMFGFEDSAILITHAWVYAMYNKYMVISLNGWCSKIIPYSTLLGIFDHPPFWEIPMAHMV